MTTAAACERCGTFADSLEALGSRQLCPSCVAHVAQAERFWPAGYLTGVGVLLNPTLSALLLGLNYRRLGEAKQATQAFVAAGALLLVYIGLIAAPEHALPRGAPLWLGVGAGIAMGRLFRPTWERLRHAGARRANVVLPIALSLLIIVIVVVGAALLFPEWFPEEG